MLNKTTPSSAIASSTVAEQAAQPKGFAAPRAQPRQLSMAR